LKILISLFRFTFALPFGIRVIFVGIISFIFAALWLWIATPDSSPSPTIETDISKLAIGAAWGLIGWFYIFSLTFLLQNLLNKVHFIIFVILLALPSFLYAGVAVLGLGLVLFFEGENFNLRIPLETVLWIVGLRFIIPVALAILPVYLIIKLQKLSEHPKYRELFLEGRGGSSSWATINTYEQMGVYIENLGTSSYPPDKTGLHSKHIILGRSLFDDDPQRRIVGVKDDAHMLTIGMTGAGKSSTVLWPNLAIYEGSAIILDPKGEHAKYTYCRRSNAEKLKDKGINGRTKKHFPVGECYMLDPFGINANTGIPSSFYNPLAEINIHRDDCTKYLDAIADGCILEEKSKHGEHFTERAKTFLKGLIVHVMTTQPKENHHLPFIVDMFYGIDPELKFANPERFTKLLEDMALNNAVGGLPQQGALGITNVGSNERGSYMSTIARSLEWCSDPSMRKHLIKSDFSFENFGLKNSDIKYAGRYEYIRLIETVYIVIPLGQMKKYSRWLRIITTLAIECIRSQPKKAIEKPTLFVLDEFPQLAGSLEIVKNGIVTLRSEGIKLWVLIQNIGQLQAIYEEEWSTFVGNSNVQVFGVKRGDMATAEWLSKTLGTRLRKEKNQISGSERMLLTPDQIFFRLSKEKNTQIVLPVESGLPMRLERIAYKPYGKFKSLPWNGLKGHFKDY